jgi:hypothetical protein
LHRNLLVCDSHRVLWPALLALAACLACAGTKTIPLAAADRAQIAQAPALHAVTRTPAAFSVRTPGAAAAGGGGVLGSVGSLTLFQQKGEAMRSEHGIADPALRVAEALGTALREDAGAPALGLAKEPAAGDEPQAIAARFGSGLVLDVRTEYWELLYYPTDWSHYRLLHRASARLLEAPSGRVLWQDECETESRDADGRPTLEALEGNGAALLKAMLDAAADECARRLRAGFARPI